MPGLPVSEAVSLFADRAPAVVLGEDVERLCDRLEGIPLAVEVAAARAESLGTATVEAGIVAALAEEAGRTVLDATLAWSHDLLDDDERACYRRLGVFAGTFTLDAAEAVVPDEGGSVAVEDVLDLVSATVERSLVYLADGGGYRQLAVVRAHAGGLARAAGEWTDLCHRHLAWAVAGTVESRSETDDRLRLDGLRLVSDDLLAALERPMDEPWTSAQVELAGALEEFWITRGAFADGRRRLEAILDGGAGYRSHRAEVLRSAGALAEAQGDLDAADSHLARSQALLEEILGELRAAGSDLLPAFEDQWVRTVTRRSEVARLSGDLDLAAALAASAVAASTPGSLIAASAAFAAGLAAFARRPGPEAEATMAAALRAAEDASADHLAADCLRTLGGVARLRGDLASAQSQYTSALVIDRRLGNQAGLARTLLNLADVAALRGATDAVDLVDEGLALARQIGDARAEADGIEIAGLLALDRGDVDDAIELLRESVKRRAAIGLSADEALGRAHLSSALVAAERIDEAVVEAARARATFETDGDRRGVARAGAAHAVALARAGSFAAAEEALARAVGAIAEGGLPLEAIVADTATAAVAEARGDPTRASGARDRAAWRAAELGVVRA